MMPRNMNCANRRVLRGTSIAIGMRSATSTSGNSFWAVASLTQQPEQRGVDAGHDDHVGDAGEEADQAGERRVRAVPPAGLGTLVALVVRSSGSSVDASPDGSGAVSLGASWDASLGPSSGATEACSS